MRLFILSFVAVLGLTTTSCEKEELMIEDLEVAQISKQSTIGYHVSSSISGKNSSKTTTLFKIENDGNANIIETLPNGEVIKEMELVNNLEDGSYEIIGSRVYYVDGVGTLRIFTNNQSSEEFVEELEFEVGSYTIE